MTEGKAHFERLRKLPLWQQSLIVTIVAVIGADALTLFFYSIFFADRLALDLILTAVITVIVAYPIAWLFLGQSAKVSRLAEELREVSRTDHLTRLANRREFMVSVGATLAASQSPEGAGVLLFIDADHFKRINDRQGHLYGDRILQRTAALLDEQARETDVVARYGGEEFVIVMPQTGLEGAGLFAERIRAEIERQLPLTVSGGVAAAMDGDATGSLLSRADAALYGAKSAGRNCVFRHNGEQIEPAAEAVPAATA